MDGKIFSVTEVANAKPAPDVFLHAARMCGVEPTSCCVVEDSPIGVMAGVAAGMTVFGYCALTPKQRLLDAGAHQTFNDMASCRRFCWDVKQGRSHRPTSGVNTMSAPASDYGKSSASQGSSEIRICQYQSCLRPGAGYALS
jgi:Haloacid dehalogenase-like hydrolase